VAELAVEVDRVADRLRSLGTARLQRPERPGRPDAAGAAHDLARRLADLAEQAEARVGRREPDRRDLPRLAPHAAGDQVAVTGADLVAALAVLGAPDARQRDAWTAEAVRALRALRHALP
jgi:hypothetical protein